MMPARNLRMAAAIAAAALLPAFSNAPSTVNIRAIQ
jgi:hypothetical protein